MFSYDQKTKPISEEPEDTAFAAQRKEILMKMALSKAMIRWCGRCFIVENPFSEVENLCFMWSCFMF